jgi:predicted MFS family arabinose efflux permease
MTLHRIAILTVLLHLAFAGARVTLSLFALDLGASAASVGVLIALLALVPMFFAVKWGRYIDRVGVRRPMYIGSVALLAALVIGCAMPRLEALFVVSTVAGCGFSLFHIAVHQAAGLIGEPQDRARNFSVLALAFSTSTVIGPVLAGFSIDGLGHRYTFLLLALPLIATIAIMLLWPIELARAPRPAAGERRRLGDLLHDRALRRVFVVSAALSMAWDLFTFVMPIHGSRLGLSATTIGLVLASFGAAVFAVRLVLPLVVHRLREWHMLVAAMFVTALAMALVPLVTDVAWLMVLAFVLGVGLGGAQPIIMALLYAKAPAGRGAEAVGVRTLLLNFSQAGIPLMFGALGTALGMTPVFLTMAIVLAAGGWYARREP